MPAEKRKKTKTPQDVPDPGDPDRKRVLNVLAQRRYRQRRREKIAELEAKAKVLTPAESSHRPSSGGVPINLSAKNTSTSPSDPLSECSGDADVEEVARDTANIDFPALDFNQDSLDFTLFSDFNFSNLPSPNQSSPDLVLQSSSSSNSSPPTVNFPITPDGSQLGIPILSAMQAFGTIVTCLNIVGQVYDPFYLHTMSPVPNPALPPNLHPTTAQIAIPHHPIIDALPWPSVREKLICIFSLPSALRPPIAQDDEGGGWGTAITRMAHDLDDFRDGLRVHGNTTSWANGNELVEEAWEIGECFYRNWWWCLDAKVVDITNRLRKERGLGVLKLRG